MKKTAVLLFVVGAMLWSGQLKAHFLVLTPSLDVVQDVNRPYIVKAIFTHPMMNGPVMEMSKPKQFGVMLDGKKISLLDSLKTVKVDGKSAYECTYKFQKPGDYIFYCEPQPYWEPSEQKYIIHYTKAVVDVCGAEEGWDSMVGFPVEIEPLVRPYSIYVGNIFQGIVKKNGKPLPFAEVEVEFYNKNNKLKPATGAHVTQVIKADANGVFSYCPFHSGWWGFAALVEGDKKMKSPDGKMVAVELGAAMWIYSYGMVQASDALMD